MSVVKRKLQVSGLSTDSGMYPKPVLYYYLILYFIQIFSISILNIEPGVIQYFFTIALFIPLFRYKEFIPFVFSLFFVTNQYYITDATFLISGNKIYTFFLITLFYGFFIKSKQFKNTDLFFVAIFIVYLFVVDRVKQINLLDNTYFLNLSLMLILFVFVNKKSAFTLLNAGLIISSFVIAFSFIIVFLQKGQQLYGTNFSDGGFRDANYLSSVIGVGYILSICHIFGLIKTNFLNRTVWIFYVIASVNIFAIILSGSRGGFLSALITTIIIILLNKKKQNAIGGNILFVTIIGFLFYILMQFGFFDLLLYRFFEEGSLDSGSGRTIILDQLISNYNNLPLMDKLFGGGYGFFSKLTYDMDPHNDFASLLTSYGIIGVALFVLLLTRFLAHFRTVSYVILIYFILVSLTISSFKTMAMPLFLLIGLNVKKFNAD